VVGGFIHLAGAGLAVAVLVVLIVFGASRGGTAWHIVGYTLYGSGLVLLYTASASYHLVPDTWSRLKSVTQKLDHAMIYVLIAATYTPVTFIVLDGVWRWSMFGVVWFLAIVGTSIKFFKPNAPHFISVVLYIVMGWLAVLPLSSLIANMSTAALWLLVSGGLFYTLGVIFFVLEKFLIQRKYFWMHEIFHVFVLGGSVSHTIMMFLIV